MNSGATTCPSSTSTTTTTTSSSSSIDTTNPSSFSATAKSSTPSPSPSSLTFIVDVPDSPEKLDASLYVSSLGLYTRDWISGVVGAACSNPALQAKWEDCWLVEYTVL